jgi:hypothetical protein
MPAGALACTARAAASSRRRVRPGVTVSRRRQDGARDGRAGGRPALSCRHAACVEKITMPVPALAVMAATLLLAAGCTARQVTVSDRSAVEQELLVRALERAVAHLDVSGLTGRRVALELFALSRDQAFAREFVAARLERRGVDVTGDAARADLRLKVFATVLGVDRGETLLGVPALQVPVVTIPIPEIALFKWVRHRGAAEVQVYAYEPRTDRLLDSVPAALGRSKFDQFTLLLVIGFTVTDLGERAEPTAPDPP